MDTLDTAVDCRVLSTSLSGRRMVGVGTGVGNS